MLTLTRESDQAIKIGDAITVTVLRIESNKISIGIDAPKEMPILRQDAIKRTKFPN